MCCRSSAADIRLKNISPPTLPGRGWPPSWSGANGSSEHSMTSAKSTCLKERLGPPPAAWVARLIADLYDDTAAVRERAALELEALGKAAELALREALKKGPASAEAAARIRDLLDPKERPGTELAPHRLRALRLVESLERNGGPEARRLLELIAGGDTEAAAKDAKAALGRLARRPDR